MKKTITILLIAALLLGITPALSSQASATDENIPVISYMLNGVTLTADLTEIGTWTPASSYKNSKVYLASLPYGSIVASYAVGDNSGLAHLVYGLNTSNRKDTEALTDSSNYLTGEEFVGTGLGSSVQYAKTAMGKLDNAVETKAQIPTNNVKGYGLRITGLSGYSPLVIIQISTDSSQPTITYQNSNHQNKAAELTELGTWTPASSYKNSKVYLASLPYGSIVTSYAVDDNSGLTHLVYGLNTSNRKDAEALSDSSNYLTNNEFVGTGLGSSVQYAKTAMGKLDNADATKAQIPTSNVKGYGLRITGLTGYSPLVIIQISTIESGDEIVDKKALGELIANVSSGHIPDYYQENDRYNGKKTSEKGFWAEMQSLLTAAQSIFDNASATQAQVNTVFNDLSASIAILIPTTQLNATALYEALQNTARYSWDVSSTLYLGNYTPGTVAALTESRDVAQDYLDSLFSGGEATDINIAANQDIADGYASDLLTARDNLLTKSNLTAAQRYRDTIVKLDAVFAALSAADYETESWNAFEAAHKAAADLLADHPVNDNMTAGDAGAYAATARNYWLAAYGLRGKSSPTVTVYFSDDFGMRYPEYAVGSSYEETLTMASGTCTLKELLTQAGLSTLDHLGYSHSYGSSGLLWDEWLAYINGVLVRDPKWASEEVGQTIMLHDKGDLGANFVDWNEIRVRSGDVVTLARVEAALKPTYVGGEGASMEEKAKFFGQLSLVLDHPEIKEGESLSGTVTRKAAHLPDYDGRFTAYPYATLAAYGPQMEDGNYPAVPIIGEDDGSLTLNQAGIYLVMAFEARAQDMSGRSYPNLNTASLPVVVTVNPLNSDELAAEKEKAIQALDDALNECSAEEFGETVYNQIFDIVNTAKGTIGSAASLAEIQNCLSAAMDEISALKETVSGENLTAYRRMSSLLMLLPAEREIDAGLFTQGDAVRMNEALAQYETMTEYQRSMLTAAQMAQWNALKDAWGSDGSSLGEARQITFTVSVVGGFGAQLDNSLNRVTTAKYSYEQSNDTYYVTNTRNTISTLAEPVTFTFDAPLESWILQVIYTESSDFEVYKVAWEGVETDGIEYINNKVDDQYQIYVRYTDALTHEITKPAVRGDVKITIYTRSTGDLESLREMDIEELTAALNGYSKSDYEAAKWTELNNAYNDGVAAISAATSESKITEAKTTALAAMAAVEKKSSGNLGTVSVIVENTTYGEADFSGAFVTKTVSLTTDSSMMKCVLSALAEAGYTWTGTGGTGYDITYLSSIYIDANGNGKPDNDEKSLAEFDGGPQSGWMGTLNDWFVNEGLNMFTIANGKLKDGDVIRAQYTVTGYGTDLGATWANNDTSLKDLTVDGGSLGTEFDSSVLEYVLTPTGGSISLLPTAANKNFQVRIFLNQQNKTANADYYRSGEIIPVKSGDVIWIGVGEKAWGTMNEGLISATWYKLHVVSIDDANAVVKLINAIGSITYSNYADKQTAVDMARAAYEALTNTAKANVNNYAALTAAEEAIAGYEAVDALKAEIAALPAVITEADRDAVETAKAHYDALTDAQRNLLTVAETNKLLKAVNTLAVLDALAAIEDTKDFASTEANTQAAVKTALEAWLNNANAAVAVDLFTAAEDGTAENLSGTAGSYSATVTVTIGSGAVAASGEKAVTGSISPTVYVKSTDAGVQSIKVSGVTATGSGTAYAATLPYGTVLAELTAASFEITTTDEHSTHSAPTSEDGTTWTFTVTAEDGTTAEYTVTLSVNSVVVTVLECGIYTVTPDVTVTELSPAAVSGLLEAVSTDALDLPQGTESVALWLSVTATAKDGEDITIRIEPIYAADNAEGQAIPAAALIGQITVTLPIPGTEYSKVLAAGEYLDAEGSESGITFTITAAGEYTLIPDAHIAAVTWHLNGGTSAVVTDGQQTIYFRSDDGADLPEAEKTGFTFKGWHSEDSIDSVAYIAVSAQLPADLYAVWQSGNVNAAVTVSGVSAVKSGSVYTVTLPYGSDYPKAADISITPEDAAATYTKPMTGDDGASWSFTVTAEDGTKQEYTLQVVIAEQTAEDILAAAKEAIEGADWNTEQQTANDAASLKAFVENKLAALELGAAYTVTVTSVTPAVAGDAENTQGVAGSYSFTVALTAGEASETAAGSGSISATAYVAPAQQADYITALNAVLPYLRSTVTNPIVGSTYGEWAVLALNRGDAATEAWNNIYLSNLKAYVDQKNGVLAEKNYTEYSRVILALTSMGVDATKFATESGTYDLVKPLLDKQASGEYWAEWQGNNGTAFALLAADSHDYLDTAEGKALRAGLIASLKANQMASGAWAISGTSSPDLDVTAAAIYALAPYYLDSSRLSALGGTVSYAEVQAMVDSALAYLSGQQNADGGFGSVEADVWAIIALSTLGRDADADPAFVKNGKSLLADMLSYQEESSGAFRHLLSGSVDQMATEEAAYGLVAYDRFKNGKNTLYDMSDVEVTSLDEKANKAAAEEVEALIDAIGEVTLESKAKIDAARAAYDALTDEQKALVGNLQTLKDAEAKYQELAEAADQEEIDKAAAKGVDELIDAIGEVTLDSEKAIKAARNAYDALTDEQKKLVEKLADLEAAEAKLEELQPLVTVTFYLQSGKSSEVAEGETKTYTKADEGKALPTASRDNYSFDGWYDAAVDGTRYTSVSAALPRELYAQWTSDSSGDSGSGGGGDSDEGKITVTMRLIGAKQAEKDVDLGAEEYMPDYVTWIATISYKLEEGSSVYDLWLQATGDAGIRSVGAEKNYVSAVFAPSSLGGYELAEFTNGKRSGWMYTINGRHPGFGLKEQELHDGDRVIWHYVNDYSYEVSDWFEADSRWPSLGDGRYYNRWLKAPDRFGGSGGGLGEGAQSSGGSGDGSGGSSEIIPSYDGDTIVIKADVEHSEGGAAYAADATLDKKTVAEGLEKAEDKSSLKVWVDIEDSNRLVLQIEPEAMKEIADAKAGLRMECSRGVIKLDADAVAKLTESGREVRMVVSYDDWNDKTTVSVRPFPPTDGDAAVMLKIELPATKDGQALSIVGSDGTTTPIKKSAIIGDRVYAEVPSGVTLTITESNRYWNDVKAGDWFADAVSFAVSHDLMNGVDRYEFAPNMPMTRAMLVTVLYRLEDEPEIAGSMSFGDVASGAWYTEAVAWAAEQEIVRGNGDGFAPNDNITREQIATVLYRYAQYLGMDVEAKGDVSEFSDGEKISSWAQDAMAWAVKVGLFKGDDTGSLNPQGNATRAEVATLLERLIKLIVVS